MSNLFEIAEDAMALADLLDELDGDVTGQEDAVQAFLVENEGALLEKVESYCKIIRSKEVAAAARREESRRIANLATADDNRAKWLKMRLRDVMEALEMAKLETATHKVSIAKNGGSLPLILDDAEAVRMEYGSLVQVLDTEAKATLRADLVDGVEVKGARLGERGTSLRIK